MLTLEEAQAILSAPPSDDKVAGMIIIAALEIDAISEIIAAENGGHLEPEVADEHIVNALVAATSERAALVDINFDEIEEEVEEMTETERSGSPATQTVLNTFGEALGQLIYHNADSVEEGIEIIRASTGIDAETIGDYLNDRTCPNMEQASAIASCFDSITANALVDLAMCAMSSQGEEIEMSRHNSRLEAEFAFVAQQQQELVDRENERTRLADIDRRYTAISIEADRLLASRQLTPAERREYPQVDPARRTEMAAYFSAYTAECGTTPEAELERASIELGFAAKRAPSSLLFSDFSMSDAIDVPIDDKQQQGLKAFRSNHSYG